jgi:hypothetical protein
MLGNTTLTFTLGTTRVGGCFLFFSQRFQATPTGKRFLRSSRYLVETKQQVANDYSGEETHLPFNISVAFCQQQLCGATLEHRNVEQKIVLVAEFKRKSRFVMANGFAKNCEILNGRRDSPRVLSRSIVGLAKLNR